MTGNSQIKTQPGAPRGQKRPLRPREVWAIRARLEMSGMPCDLALFNLAIDSKLRGCDLVRLKVSDVFSAGSICSPSGAAEAAYRTRYFLFFEGGHFSRIKFFILSPSSSLRISARSNASHCIQPAMYGSAPAFKSIFTIRK